MRLCSWWTAHRPSADDREIAQILRRLGKPVTLAVNKTEGQETGSAAAEFFALGLGDPLAISAAHGEGLDALMSRVLHRYHRSAKPSRWTNVPRIAVAGRPNVGKSDARQRAAWWSNAW